MKPQRIFLNGLVLPLSLAVSMSAMSASADVVVVVSTKSAVTRLTAEQITRIFLGKTDAFPNGGNAIPVDQAEGTTIRDEFYSKVTNKSSSQVTAYWARIIFTGDGQPPKSLQGNVTVKRAIADNPHAIGYIDKSAVDSSVRVVLEP